MGDELGNFMEGKTTAQEFARKLAAYYESPEWRREKARLDSERLLQQKAGRELLFSLIEEAEKSGARVSYEFCPISGGDSIMLTLDGVTMGYPDFMGPEVVKTHFAEHKERAEGRRGG